MKRSITLAAAVAATMLLAGCLLMPGRFTSQIDLRRDGSFSFAYKGEIHVLALSKAAEEEGRRKSENEMFEPAPCYDDDSGEKRKCSKEELAEQRRAWEQDIAASRAAAAEKKKSDDQMMKAMLGGIDPADPRAAAEFADRLRRQKGWKSVVDRGDGRFEVEYAVSGRLDHDFSFPLVEKLPMVTPFITMIRRADGGVRIEAPAMTPASNGNPFMGAATAVADEKSTKAGGEGMPVLDGVLTIVTDGEILANNTDEGPTAVPNGMANARALVWKVNARTREAPTALIRITP
ncbi:MULTISPECIES: hypothetical protein [Novosphingobium]|uniref:hypothetical protein n=1 Tax=Novosphingobium TaxID=165696 RepID=UPI000D6EAD42|nr:MULTISPECIES: hypothetical protein [Novosphingobium]